MNGAQEAKRKVRLITKGSCMWDGQAAGREPAGSSTMTYAILYNSRRHWEVNNLETMKI